MGKAFGLIIFALAIVMSILVGALPLDKMHDYILVMRFFENMIPILAVGALVKYIGCPGSK